ncbi:MAG: hypothetical protein ACKVH0_12970, partial [Alphaproteobacteria bacterium]
MDEVMAFSNASHRRKSKLSSQCIWSDHMKRICAPNDRLGVSASAKLQIYVGNGIFPEAAALAA